MTLLIDPYRFSSGPPVLSSQQVAWWADDIAGLADTDPLGTWTDRVRGLAWSASGAQRPTYRVFSSIPEVVFNGSANRMETAGADVISTASSGCVVAVMRPYSLTGLQAVLASADDSQNDRYIRFLTDAGKPAVDQQWDDTYTEVRGGTTLVEDTDYSLVEWSSTGTAYELRVNGVVESKTVVSGSDNGDWFSDTPSGSGRDRTVLGARIVSSGASAHLNGAIHYLTVCDAQLSTDDRSALEAWATARYGI